MAKYLPCPRCRSNGRDTKGDNLQIYPDGGGYCHSCGYTQRPGFISRIGMPLEGTRIRFKTLSEPILPYGISIYPEWAIDWLNRYQLSPFDFPNSYYSPEQERMIFTFDSKWIGRSNGVDPKWFGNPGLQLLRRNSFDKTDVLVVVEDYISGYKLSKFYDTLVLFGTTVSVNELLTFNYGDIVVWLDPDKNKEMINYSRYFNSIGINCNLIFSNKDPKEYNYKQLINKINY